MRWVLASLLCVLSGCGLLLDSSVDQFFQPGISARPLSLDNGTYDFGELWIGQPITQSLLIRNLSGRQITGLTASPAQTPFYLPTWEFPSTGTCTETVEPWSACILDVEFIPHREGLNTNGFRLHYDYVGESASNVLQLSGTGRAGTSATLDTQTFGSNGNYEVSLVAGTEGLRTVAIQRNLKIVGAGKGNNGFVIARWSHTGAIDTSFHTDGITGTDLALHASDRVEKVLIDSSERIIAMARYNQLWGVFRFQTDGTADTSFNSVGIVVESGINQPRSGVIDTDGKLVVGGGSSAFQLIRYHTDGTRDVSFGTGGRLSIDISTINDAVASLAIQSNGKLLAGGSIQAFGAALVRVTTNGVLDTTFGTDGRAIPFVTAAFGSTNLQGAMIAIHPDGSVWFGGGSIGGSGRISKFSSEGSLDTSFGTGGAARFPTTNEQSTHPMVVQSDGKVIAAALDTDISRVMIARFTSNGAVDSSWGTNGVIVTSIGATSNSRPDLILQTDGKFLTVGSSVDGQSIRIERYWP